MKKIIDFDTPYTIEVEKETVGAINLRVKAMKSTGENDGQGNPILELAPIFDLNKISIEVTLIRANGRETKIMRGHLANNLIGMFAQTVKYALTRKKTNDGYFHYFDFNPYAIGLNDGDKLKVDLTVGSSAYESVRKMDSLIEFETVEVKSASSEFPVIRSYPIGKDKEEIDINLGDNVVKVVALTDLKKDYLSSTEAKLTLGSLRAQGFYKNFTQTSLFVQNMHYFDNNPESDVEDLCVYQAQNKSEILNDVKIVASLDKPALETAKIMVVAMERI